MPDVLPGKVRVPGGGHELEQGVGAADRPVARGTTRMNPSVSTMAWPISVKDGRTRVGRIRVRRCGHRLRSRRYRRTVRAAQSETTRSWIRAQVNRKIWA